MSDRSRATSIGVRGNRIIWRPHTGTAVYHRDANGMQRRTWFNNLHATQPSYPLERLDRALTLLYAD